MHRFSIFSAAIALATTHASASQASSSSNPHVLFISVDDLNDWIGCLGGHPQAQTPHIDSLASRGILFTNAHCASPACNPSRAAVFSGKMPSTTGVWSNLSKSLKQQQPDAKLLPMAFSDAGYETYGTGKLLHQAADHAFQSHHRVGQRWSPLSLKKVRYTADELPSKGSANPRHLTTDRSGNAITLPLNRMPSDRTPDSIEGESFDWGPIDAPDIEYGDTQTTNWALDKLKKKFKTPFFLAVGYYRPHIPLWAPERYFARFKDAPATLPPTREDDLEDLSAPGKKRAHEAITAGSHKTVIEHGQWRAAVEAYLACTTYIDDEIGRLLQALDASPYAQTTTIVLWSDHGWHLGEKEHWGKWAGWERSTRVPLIIVPPKKSSNSYAAGGSKCAQPVSLIDLYPTLVEMSGISAPPGLEGQSLVPLLKAPDTVTSRNVLTQFDPGNSTLRSARWRYIVYADGSEELYDHSNDPNEWDNLAKSSEPEHQKVLASMRTAND